MKRNLAGRRAVNDKYNQRLVVVVILTLLIPSLLFCQQREDFIRPFFGYYGSQSLATAIGNATVASGQVLPGFSSNPANIGLSRFGHVQVNFQNNRFEGPETTCSSTAPGGIFAILPVPVYRGGLAVSGGIQKMTDFTSGFKTVSGEVKETGGIYATEVGAAYEAAENFFIGGAFRYLKGSNELLTSEPDTNSLLNPTYEGYSFSVGFLNRTTPHLQFGAAVDLPTSIEVRDKLTEWTIVNPRASTSDIWNYTLTRPLNFHAGFSLLYPLWSGFYELEWCDWSILEFDSDTYYEGDIAVINQEISNDFRQTFSQHFGAAVHLPWLPLHLYCGYQYLPAPYEESYVDDSRQSVSFGASYLLNQQFSLHSSISNYFWDYRYRDGSVRDESNRMVVFGGTFHF